LAGRLATRSSHQASPDSPRSRVGLPPIAHIELIPYSPPSPFGLRWAPFARDMSEGWRRGWDSNPPGLFGFCKLQILNYRDCRRCRRCRGALPAIARNDEPDRRRLRRTEKIRHRLQSTRSSVTSWIASERGILALLVAPIDIRRRLLVCNAPASRRALGRVHAASSLRVVVRQRVRSGALATGC
jgi:hypothetical protein